MACLLPLSLLVGRVACLCILIVARVLGARLRFSRVRVARRLRARV